MEEKIIELSVVMPCLNEKNTLATVITKAKQFFKNYNIEGEIVIADNGSDDGSIEIARSNHVKLVRVEQKGYGAALSGGISAATGKYIIMGDADDSYDFTNLSLFVEKLREGYDLVMGNRFKGGIKKGAMPFLHKYLGNPVLSFIGKLFFNIHIGDFHCGLRGFKKEAIIKLNLQTTGMEYASEMVVRSALENYRITEVSTILYKDGRDRPPHLRTWSDGWRHLRFLLMYSPKWLFFIPGTILFFIGLLLGVPLIFSEIKLGSIVLDIHTLLFCSFLTLIGYQSISFWFFTKIYAIEKGFLPEDKKLNRVFDFLNLEKGVTAGIIVLFLGILLWLYLFISWAGKSYEALDPRHTMRIAIPALTMIILGIQLILYSFFFSILGLKKK